MKIYKMMMMVAVLLTIIVNVKGLNDLNDLNDLNQDKDVQVSLRRLLSSTKSKSGIDAIIFKIMQFINYLKEKIGLSSSDDSGYSGPDVAGYQMMDRNIQCHVQYGLDWWSTSDCRHKCGKSEYKSKPNCSSGKPNGGCSSRYKYHCVS